MRHHHQVPNVGLYPGLSRVSRVTHHLLPDSAYRSGLVLRPVEFPILVEHDSELIINQTFTVGPLTHWDTEDVVVYTPHNNPRVVVLAGIGALA